MTQPRPKSRRWPAALSRRHTLAAMLMTPVMLPLLAGRGSLAAEPAVTPAAAPDAEERFVVGDKLRVIVFGHEDLSGEFEIDAAGGISLPLIRTVQAAGLTPSELEEEIAGRLSPDYLKEPRVSVERLSTRPFYILGEVNRPGSYPHEKGLTVDRAVATAGGYTYRARTSRLTIIRGTDPTRQPQPATHDTAVFPGDVIEVPERYF